MFRLSVHKTPIERATFMTLVVKRLHTCTSNNRKIIVLLRFTIR